MQLLERPVWPQHSSNSMMMIEGGHRRLLGYSTLLTASLSSGARGCISMIKCKYCKARWMLCTIHVEGVEAVDLLLIFYTAVLTRRSARRSWAWLKRNSTRPSCQRTPKLQVLHTQDLARAKNITESTFTMTISKGSSTKTNSESHDTFHRVWQRKRHSRRNLRTICIRCPGNRRAKRNNQISNQSKTRNSKNNWWEGKPWWSHSKGERARIGFAANFAHKVARDEQDLGSAKNLKVFKVSEKCYFYIGIFTNEKAKWWPY